MLLGYFYINNPLEPGAMVNRKQSPAAIQKESSPLLYAATAFLSIILPRVSAAILMILNFLAPILLQSAIEWAP